jgi:hypothetical protein
MNTDASTNTESRESELTDPGHEEPEPRDVEHDLRLDELGAGLDLLTESHRTEIHRRRERVLHRADEERRRNGQGPAAHVGPVVPHAAGDPQQILRVQIVDRLRFGMVPGRHVVPGHAHDVAGTEDRSSQHVGLEAQAVPIAARELHHGLHAPVGEEVRRGHRGDVRVRRAVVGAVDGIDLAAEEVGELGDGCRIRTVGRLELGGHDELTRSEQSFEVAPGPVRRHVHSSM